MNSLNAQLQLDRLFSRLEEDLDHDETYRTVMQIEFLLELGVPPLTAEGRGFTNIAPRGRAARRRVATWPSA